MKISRKIRVLVVDDSMFFREAIVQGVSADPMIEVVGTAKDAFSARDCIVDLQPDVMTLDVEMPRMNGVDFLRQLIPQYPLPVVMVTGVDNNLFDALGAGAVDFVKKPDAAESEGLHAFISELIVKIKIASTAKLGHLKRPGTAARAAADGAGVDRGALIAIGASTGGTEAIFAVMRTFPREMPGIVIVQHMPPVFTRMYAERLNNACAMEVSEAKDGDAVLPGRALIAPGGYQMRVQRAGGDYTVRCTVEEKVNGHSPSVDVLFDSVAKTAGAHAVGVILTGMGNDGAKGLLNMRKNGAYTIGQDEQSCVVYGMPMVAFNIGGVERQAPLDEIGGEVLRYLKKNRMM